MKKVAIITSGSLPVPAIRGGGVETLVDVLINENEKNHDFDFTVFTVYDESAIQIQGQYRYSRFINIKEKVKLNRMVLKANTYLYALNRRTFKSPQLTLQRPFCHHILHHGNLKEYDVVLVESNLEIVPELKKHGASRVIYHAHYNDVHLGVTEYEQKRFNFIYRFIDTNISVSHFLERNIRSVIERDLNYYVVENCANAFVPIHKEEREFILTQYGIPREKTVIMYSGRITSEKGVAQLLHAYKMLDNLTKICLVIVGGAFYSDNTENDYTRQLHAIANSCKNPVIFTGYINHPQMLKLWQLADLAVLPTYDVEEAAGLVVIEALTAGVPVIHTDSGGMPEYSSPECAVIVKRGDKFVERLAKEMEALCLDTEKRMKMGMCAKGVSKIWSRGNYYKKLKNALQD